MPVGDMGTDIDPVAVDGEEADQLTATGTGKDGRVHHSVVEVLSLNAAMVTDHHVPFVEILTAVDLQTERGDLKLVRGRANLAQAVLNRLFTRQGALARLGHPDYGSRLYLLPGEPNNRRTRAPTLRLK